MRSYTCTFLACFSAGLRTKHKALGLLFRRGLDRSSEGCGKACFWQPMREVHDESGTFEAWCMYKMFLICFHEHGMDFIKFGFGPGWKSQKNAWRGHLFSSQTSWNLLVWNSCVFVGFSLHILMCFCAGLMCLQPGNADELWARCEHVKKMIGERIFKRHRKTSL